jgi:DNA-binding transcriptional ArsR family regulator
MDQIDAARAAAQAGKLLASPLRMRLLMILNQEGALAVSDLVALLGAPQPRVSAHLALLRQAGWVEGVTQGRQRLYRITSPQITDAIQMLSALPSKRAASRRAQRREKRNSAVEARLREARTCYDHLAGKVGVWLCEQLLQRKWLVPVMVQRGKYQPEYGLTEAGEKALISRGVQLLRPSGRRRFAYACPDWTERRPHLGGTLGAMLLQALEEAKLVQRLPGTRAVEVQRDLSQWLKGKV